MIYISRSSVEAAATCRRRGYYTYHYMRTGVEASTPSMELLIGIGLHAGMEILFRSKGDITAADAAVHASWESELGTATLTEQYIAGLHVSLALLYGWYRTAWEQFNEQFDILLIEQEVPMLVAPNVTLRTRADLVVRDRFSGLVSVFNWKSTSSMKDWTEKWEDEIQAATEAMAVEHLLGEPVHGCIFEGFYKGQVYGGHFTSPLLRGFICGEEYSHKNERPSKEKPWRRFDAWAETFPFGEGLAAWIGFLPREVVAAQFCRSQPIIKNNDVVLEWIAATVKEETDAEHILEVGSEADKLLHFRQRWGFWCRRCTFRGVCKKQVDIAALVEDGQLVARKDHHGEIPAEEE